MIDLETILILVSESLGIHRDLITSKSRQADIVDARSLYVFFSILNGHNKMDVIKSINRRRQMIAYHVSRVEQFVKYDTKMQGLYAKCSESIKLYKKYSAGYHEKRI